MGGTHVTNRISEYRRQIMESLCGSSSCAEQLMVLVDQEIRFAAQEYNNVSIVGAMSSGKSTLVNALLGDTRAPTGVNETTATLNYFIYHPEPSRTHLKAQDDDGTVRFLPIDDGVDELSSDETLSQIAQIEYESKSELLKSCAIVDTPGFNSVIEAHKSLSRSHVQTVSNGIIYVSKPIQAKSETDFIAEFNYVTRGSSAKSENCICVLQMWEGLDVDEPFCEAERLSKKLQRSISMYAKDVFPVSGLLFNAARKLDEQDRSFLIKCARDADLEIYNAIYTSSKIFASASHSTLVDKSVRADLLKKIGWPALRYFLKAARRERELSTTDFFDEMMRQSGIDKLKTQVINSFCMKSAELSFAREFSFLEPVARLAIHRLEDDNKHLQCVMNEPDVIPLQLDYIRSKRQAVLTSIKTIECVLSRAKETILRESSSVEASALITSLIDGDSLPLAQSAELQCLFECDEKTFLGEFSKLMNSPEKETLGFLKMRCEEYRSRAHIGSRSSRRLFLLSAERLEQFILAID